MSNLIHITIKNPKQEVVNEAIILLNSYQIDSCFHDTKPLTTNVGCDPEQFDFYKETLHMTTEFARFPFEFIRKHKLEGFFFDHGALYGFIKMGILDCIEDKYEFNKMDDFYYGDSIEVTPLSEFQNRLSKEEMFNIEERQLINSFFIQLKREENYQKVDTSLFSDLQAFAVFPEGQNVNNSFLKITKSVIVEPDQNLKSQYTIQSSKLDITLSSFLETMFEVRNYLIKPINLKCENR